MSEVFALELGQLVAHRTAPSRPYVILSRYREECTGGFQTLYRCRSSSLLERMNLVDFFEIELQPWVEKPKAVKP